MNEKTSKWGICKSLDTAFLLILLIESIQIKVVYAVDEIFQVADIVTACFIGIKECVAYL